MIFRFEIIVLCSFVLSSFFSHGKPRRNRYKEDLFDTIYRRDFKRVKRAVKQGACPGVRIMSQVGFTAVHHAVNNDYKSLLFLLENGFKSEVSMKTYSLDTPLHYAARVGCSRCVKLLLQYGSDINAVNSVGATPFYLAATRGNTKVMEVLIEENAVTSITPKNSRTALFLLENLKAPLNEIYEREQFAYRRKVILNEKSKRLNKLIERLKVIQNRFEECFLEAVKKGRIKKLEDCARNNVNVFAFDKHGETALHHAARSGKIGVVKRLLQFGFNINVRNGLWSTAIDIAASCGHYFLVDYLIKQGAFFSEMTLLRAREGKHPFTSALLRNALKKRS